MKILHHDQDTLVLRPNFGAVFMIFGGIFAIAGLLMTYFLGTTTTLACEWVQGSRLACELDKTFLGLSLSSEVVEGLRGARLHSGTDSDGDTTYKIMLVTTAGERPLANFSSSDYRAQTTIVDEINTFLQTRSQPTLEAARGGRWNLLFGLPFLLVGVGMVAASFQANSTTWTFDRTQGTITHQRGTLAGPRVDAYAMHDIAQVHLNESSDSDGDSTYRIELWTHTGQRIPMTKVYTSGYKNKERAIEIIRAFLRA